MIEDDLVGEPVYLKKPRPEVRREMFVHEDSAIDAVVGYRSWRIRMFDGHVALRSVICLKVEWYPGHVQEKRCLCRGDLDSPLNHLPGACRDTCGIYAWADHPRPLDAKCPRPRWQRSSDYIHGEVYLWGKVKIHERGYRAQRALPSAFYLYPNSDPLVQLRVKMAALQFDVPLVQQ